MATPHSDLGTTAGGLNQTVSGSQANVQLDGVQTEMLSEDRAHLIGFECRTLS